MAYAADGEEILAFAIVLAVIQILIILNEAIDATAHENMRMPSMIRFYLLKTFVHPINAIPAINHKRIRVQMGPMDISY